MSLDNFSRAINCISDECITLYNYFPIKSDYYGPDYEYSYDYYGAQNFCNPNDYICDLVLFSNVAVDDALVTYAPPEYTETIWKSNAHSTVLIPKDTILARGVLPGEHVTIDVKDLYGVNIGIFITDPGDVCWINSNSASTCIMNSILVEQGHHDIIPFTYIIEQGIQDNTNIGFKYQTTPSSINYDAIITINTASSASTTIVPESDDAKYKHEPIFYIDIIVEGQGVDKYSLRSQETFYTTENPSMTYNIPKFTWSNSIFGDNNSSSESSTDLQEGYVWVGTGEKKIKKIYYNSEFANEVFNANVASEVYNICFSKDSNDIYVTGLDYLYRYLGSFYYMGDNYEFHNENQIPNDNEIAYLSDSNSEYLINVNSYQGKIILRDKESMDKIIEYGGFDAPFKIIWSEFHKSHLVAGTRMIWKLNNGQKSVIYGIKNHSIIDMDCSENGIIGIIFKEDITNNYIIRFIDNNLYTILYNEKVIDKSARFCKYCGQGKFYVLQELNSNEDSYASLNYVFNSIDKTLAKTESSNSIVTTTTTTTLPHPTSKVEILQPTNVSVIEKGESFEIKWVSNASYGDLVKIELYKGTKMIDTISNQAGNTGIYVWDVANTYANGSDYSIKITWLAAGDTTNFDISSKFTITDIPLVTTTTTTKIVDRAIGVDYNDNTNQIVIALSNGLIGFYNLDDYTFMGLFDSGVRNITCISSSDKRISKFRGVNKVRVYVGSEPNTNDKWDSGVIETEQNSMYYGGGNNLVNGHKYYVNIQVYSNKFGWSEVQTNDFIMPG